MSSAATDPARTYHRMQIETASIPSLVCMLHEQCALHLRQAMGSDAPLRRSLLDNVQNMLVLLQRSLRPVDATAKGLFHLYDYCYCICEREGATELRHAATILNMLRRTFDELRGRPRPFI